MKKLSLLRLWKIRLGIRDEGNKLYDEGGKLRAEGSKLYAEGSKLYAEGNRLYAEGNRLYAEGNRLRAEGGKLRAEGDIIFIKGVIALHGNIKLEWKNYNPERDDHECHLGNGEVYGFDEIDIDDTAEVTMSEVCEKFGKNVKIRKG